MDEPEIPLDVASETSPLRAIMTEIHEIYQELRYVGFPDAAANDIVAHLVLSVVHSRSDDEEGFGSVELGDDEEDFDDDDYDGVGEP